MKFLIIICLIFTHYLCGTPCVVENGTFLHTAISKAPNKAYKHITFLTIAETPQITNTPSHVFYNKRFAKRYRKVQKLLTARLQCNNVYAGFCRYKTLQNKQVANHSFNPWLPIYLSLFAFFRR